VEEKDLRKWVVKDAVDRFNRWDELKDAIERKDREQIEELVSDLMRYIEQDDQTYVKRTYEIREDLYDRLRIFCVQHGYKQKTVINAALEAFLQLW
jgi:hypothetical protein